MCEIGLLVLLSFDVVTVSPEAFYIQLFICSDFSI